MAAKAKPEPAARIRFQYNGQPLEALPGETILQAAQRAGFELPHLCYQQGYRPDGNCRACMVEIKGEHVLAPACWRPPEAGMQVRTDDQRSQRVRRMVLELLLSDMPEQGKSPYNCASELDHWTRKLKLARPRFAARASVPAPDTSNPAITVNLDACIHCTRCVRACREEQVNDVIGYAFRGSQSQIVFDLDDQMGESSCVSCGECVQACPTGALMPAAREAQAAQTRRVNSVCPYCGVGCLLSYHVQNGRLMYVKGRDGPANKSRLCVKGRYGFDYVHHPARLRQPLIRLPDAPKEVEPVAPGQMMEYFREAEWDEALDLAASKLRHIRDHSGSAALAGFGSAKCSNEEAYLFQKLVRTGFGNNNVDHCTRLCHASSVVALIEGIGSGAVSNPVEEVAETDLILVIGARPTVNHPVAATFMKNAVRAGTALVLMDPYRSDLARHATHFLQFRPDTDVLVLNAIMHTIVEEKLHDEAFVRARTTGFEAFRENLRDYPPEKIAARCGIAAETLREVARLYARAPRAMVFWGMGISQHVHGTDNARCLIALALLTGQIGRPGTGLHPLRGQNNVQGASDMGLIPMVYTDYQKVDDAGVRQHFERAWQCELNPRPGLTVVEIMHAISTDEIRGMYIMGENPAMSDPDLKHARAALAKLDHLVVQDIFFTQTASYADVILPASAFPEKTGTFTNTDRRVQLGRQALEPPGQARQDLWIIQQMANRMGLPWNYRSPQQVFEELRVLTPSIAGMSWQRLEREDSLIYPLLQPDDPGQAVLFQRDFPTADTKGKLSPVRYRQADELPDHEYPLVFTTGRQLEHWHTGSMTRNASVLDAIEPAPSVYLHPSDLTATGAQAGDYICVESRRGRLTAIARADEGLQPGNIFMAFGFHEAAANLLTNAALDPDAKIPEFKYCAARISRSSAPGHQKEP